MPSGTKHLLQSRAIWGGIIGIALSIFQGASGIEIDADFQSYLVDGAVASVGVIGGALAIIGRIKAKKSVKL